MERQAEVQGVEGYTEVHRRVQLNGLELLADRCWELLPCCPVQGQPQERLAAVVVCSVFKSS